MKLKTLSMLIAATLSAGALTGCNFYDSPPNSGGGGELPPPELPDVADVVAANSTELLSAIDDADAGAIIGLSSTGEFDALGNLVLDKPITLVTTDEEGNIPTTDSRNSTAQAVISGNVCIDIPDDADQILKGTAGVLISNIEFSNVVLDECGTEGGSTSRSIINIGKVGDGATPVVLDNLTFDGTNFTEMSSSGAWIYSRGLFNLTNSTLKNKAVDNTSMDIVHINCGSNRVMGGSARATGPIISDNNFSLAELVDTGIRGVIPGMQFKDNQCGTTISNNSFDNFPNDIVQEDDISAAIADGSEDLTEKDNTFNGEGTTPPSEAVTNVAELREAVDVAASGDTIFLASDGDFESIGTLIIDKPLTLTTDSSADSQAIISGETCIDIPTSADGVLKETTGVNIKNIRFENVVLSECGSEDTSRSIVNVGKVGDGATPVILDNLTFDGANFSELSSTGAWIYTRGLIEVTNNTFENKLVDNTSIDTIQINCGSNRVTGGSSNPSGAFINNNTFSLIDDADTGIRGIVSGMQFNDKTCQTKVTNNTFNGYANEVVDYDGVTAAIADGSLEGVEQSGNTFNSDEGTPPGEENVAAVNTRIKAASVGETITLTVDGDYSEGVIELSKAVILNGDNSAIISGNACITVTAPGAEIRNLTFENDYLGFDGSDQNNTCALGTSDGQSGAISIDKIGKDDAPVVLDNLIFDAENTVDQGSFGAKKASWVFSYGHFHLTNSEFKNLASNVQNNGVHINCSSDNARFGSVIEANTFTINDAGSSETAAIKIGDSSGSQIKAGNNEECNVTINDNIFDGYKTLLTADLNNDSGDERPAGIFAHASALNSDADETNSIQ